MKTAKEPLSASPSLSLAFLESRFECRSSTDAKRCKLSYEDNATKRAEKLGRTF